MKKKNGFTLVELLAVIAIVAILLVIAVPNVMKMSGRVKDRGLTSKIEAIEEAAVTYAQNNSNKIKGKFGKCNESTSASWCKCEPHQSTGSYKRTRCRYIFQITIDELIEAGEYTSENNKDDKSTCDVADPSNNQKCMDCAKITIYLDGEHKNATAELDRGYTNDFNCTKIGPLND